MLLVYYTIKLLIVSVIKIMNFENGGIPPQNENNDRRTWLQTRLDIFNRAFDEVKLNYNDRLYGDIMDAYSDLIINNIDPCSVKGIEVVEKIISDNFRFYSDETKEKIPVVLASLKENTIYKK